MFTTSAAPEQPIGPAPRMISIVLASIPSAGSSIAAR